MKRLLLLCLYGMFFSIPAFCQDEAPKLSVITADSLASGNYKDVFVSFFKLALNEISGPQKGVAFTSNPYAIMARANPDLTVDTNYVKYRHLRNLNFTAELGLDSTYRLRGFQLGVKYALVNKRDVTVSEAFVAETSKQREFDALRDAIAAEVSLQHISVAEMEEVNKWMNDPGAKFSSLSAGLQPKIKKLVAANNLARIGHSIESNPDMSFRAEAMKIFDSVKEAWQRKPLWTVSANTVFAPLPGSTQGTVDNATFTSEFLWAFTAPNSAVNLEMDILATDSLKKDNTLTNQNLAHNVLVFEPGVNIVFKSKDRGKSFFEFKLSGSYIHIVNPYAWEKTSNSTLNAVVRVRLINDTWVPVTIKMDDRGNVYGSLGVKLNFNALRSILSEG